MKANALTEYSQSINSDPRLGIFVFQMVSRLVLVRSCKDKPISKCISIPPRWPLFFPLCCNNHTGSHQTNNINSTC